MNTLRRRFGMVLILLISVLAGFIILMAFGDLRWKTRTRRIVSQLESSRVAPTVKTYDPEEIMGLPPPVQRYLSRILRKGQPLISGVYLEHQGFFNTSEDGERWCPFTSRQRVITRPPGFDWEARVRMMPGITARVHDAFVQGEGILHASLFGLVTIVDLHDTPEIRHGELMRYLAEAPWYPTCLLPSQGTHWEPVDDRSAKATIAENGTTLSLTFRFSEDDLVESVYADARGRAMAKQVVPMPWEGKWHDYREIEGLLVPTRGEVSWVLPEGRKPYWRGKVTRIQYEFASPGT